MKIKLNDKKTVDLGILIESRLLVQANSGGGKSWAIRRIIEQAFGHVQIIVLDPEGEFANLRSKFDFVYVGKGGDAPAEPRAAALLAKRLLELKASAIIDLYELSPQERKHFVRLFCDSLVNAPKELWHDALVIIDEAHVFAPEKGESEALGAVIDLASRGRKRGYCAILATQRPAKLNKDAAAECNNKLIGRASLDIDRKRAGEELGFTTKEDILSLRDLDPGEFYTFGPAISRSVEKITIGEVSVKPAKRGVARAAKPPAPSASVKKILAQLKDLPQEAQKEAQTLQEMRVALKQAHNDLRLEKERKVNLGKNIIDLDAIDEAVRRAEAKKDKAFETFRDKIKDMLLKNHGNMAKILEIFDVKVIEPSPIRVFKQGEKPKDYALPSDFKHVAKIKPLPAAVIDGKGVGEGEMKVLAAIAQYPGGVSREHVTVLTGYKRSTRDKYIYLLISKGLVTDEKDAGLYITADARPLIANIDPLPEGRELAEYYIRTLPEGEAKILKFLFEKGETMGVAREEISEATGFQRSTRDKYIYLLRVRQLVSMRGTLIKISDHLL